MTATNELDAALCQEELPDEFSRLSSSSSPRDSHGVAFVLSGIVACQHDDVTCPLMLRRHLVVQAWSQNFTPGVQRYV
ncbi:hypothetical protein [Microvirga sp. P5_D2]